MRMTARFQQGTSEVKRYVLDYTLDLAVGETITGLSVLAISTPKGQSDAGSPNIVVNNIAPLPNGLQVSYYVRNGLPGARYYVTFLATTTIGQVLEDIVGYTFWGTAIAVTGADLTTDDDIDITTDNDIGITV